MTIGAWVGMGLGLLTFMVTIVTIAVKLSASFTELNTTMKSLSEAFKTFNCGNKEEHNDMWGKIDDHDEKLSDHATRIAIIESKPPRKAKA